MSKPRRPDPEDDFDRGRFEMIDEYGWAVLSVFPDEDDDGQAFAYSTGIFEKFKSPEIIVFGLDLDLMSWLCNEYGGEVEKGKRFAENVRYDGFLEGFPVEFRNVNMARAEVTSEYMRYTSWYYFGEPFPAQQLVWPGSSDGLFPWEDGCAEEVIESQPRLDQPVVTN